MNKNSIAAQLFTLRDYLKTPKDIECSLKKVKEIGYNAVQASGLWPVDPQFLKDITDSLGLRICATHISLDSMKNDIASVIKEHKLWNCEFVGLGCMPAEYQRNKEGYLQFARDISPIAKELSKNGLKFIYHNHKFEFQKYDGITALELLMNETDPDTVGFEIDTYWVQSGGANPVQWLKKVAGRIDVVHFKDMEIVDDKQEMAAIGEGNLDWASIIDVCRENKVKWYAVEQDVCPRDPFDCLASSFKYIEKYI